MRSDPSGHNLDHSSTDLAQTRLYSLMSWHHADEERVRHAFAAALDALDERANSAQFMLDDPFLYGLSDPDRIRP